MEKHEEAFDEIIDQVGGQGKYQKILMLTFLAPLHGIACLMVLVQIFQVTTPTHWCYVPGRPDNISENLWKNITIPKEGDGFSSCMQYNNVMASNNSSPLSVIECQSGWSFDTTWYDSTIVTEKEWVCGKELYSAQWISIGIIGSCIGIVLFNNLADKIGRKSVTIWATVWFGVFGIIRVYVRSRWLLYTTMFISCMSVPAIIVISFILVMEQVSPLYRSAATCVTFVAWIVGMCLLPLIAWLSKSWVTLGLVTSVLSLAHVPIQCYFSESPRWLACMGKISESKKCLVDIAKMNGEPPPVALEEKLKLFEKPPSKENWTKATFELFKSPKLRIRTILLTTSYSCINIVYYGLLYNNENMLGNPFLNFFLFAIAEIPSCLVGYVSTNWLGRRLTGSLFQLLTSISIVLAIMIQSWSEEASVGTLITAKSIVNISFFTVYVQYVELYPTSHRSTGTGFTTVVVYIVVGTVPYIVQSSSYWPNLPYVVFALCSIIGAISAHLLPETLGQNLPQVIDDVENGFDSQPLWKYHGKRFCFKKKSTSSV